MTAQYTAGIGDGTDVMQRLRQLELLFVVGFVMTASFGSPASAEMKDVVTLLLRVCMAGGTWQQLEGEARGDVAITLRALRTGDLGAKAAIDGKYTKADWEGLQGGISAGMTQVQAQQADAARECLKPYMSGIVQAILQSK
jgi:hypothetical protein